MSVKGLSGVDSLSIVSAIADDVEGSSPAPSKGAEVSVAIVFVAEQSFSTQSATARKSGSIPLTFVLLVASDRAARRQRRASS
jgi:hypothetical protein